VTTSTARAQQRYWTLPDATLEELQKAIDTEIRKGNYASALTTAETFVSGTEQRFGMEHPNTAIALNSLGLVYQGLGRYAEAEAVLRRSLDIAAKALGPENYAATLTKKNLSLVYRSQGRLSEAELLLRSVAASTEITLGPEHPDVASTLTDLAGVVQQQQRLSEAETIYRRAIAISEKSLGPDNPSTIESKQQLAQLYTRTGQIGMSTALLTDLLQRNPRSIRLHRALAEAFEAQGRYSDAEAIFQDLLLDDDNNLPLRLSLANNRRQQGKLELAERDLERLLQAPLLPAHRRQTLTLLAQVRIEKGQIQEAEAALSEVVASVEGLLASDPNAGPNLYALTTLAELRANRGDIAGARNLLVRVASIQERTQAPPSEVAATRQRIASLDNVGSAVTDAALVTLLYGTDRKFDDKQNKFLPERGRKIELGSATVRVPDIKYHNRGAVERPLTFLRVEMQSENKDKHFTLHEMRRLSSAEFSLMAADASAQSKLFEKQAIVFIHGYNVSFTDGAFRATQIVFDMGFDGPTFFYSWPSAEKYLAYRADIENAEQATPYLAEFLKLAVRSTSGGKVHVVAHSMGSGPLLRALATLKLEGSSELASIQEIVLAAPDIDRDVFEKLVRDFRPETEKRTTIYASANDRALDWSGIAAYDERLGFIGRSGPSLVSGVDVIDISMVGGDIWGHQSFANPVIISDLRSLFTLGTRPPHMRPTGLRQITVNTGHYWRY
jgi:esterase/lipase superfamily enzyme/Tfp pilus assembly protein PilF